MFKKQLSNEL